MGCVQPLGPGFLFSARQTAIRASTAAPGQLHVRVVDHLNNVGDRPLHSLEVHMPQDPSFGVRNFQMIVDGNKVSTESNANLDPRMIRAAFDPAWEQQQPREIVTEWDLIPVPSAAGNLVASASAFYIADDAALPLWQPPFGVFTKGGPDPLDEVLTVSAPADFRVFAPGKPVKVMNPPLGIEVSRSFRVKPLEDFLPFVVAGRYEEQVINARGGAVSFWTFHPLNPQQARTAADRLASTMQAFRDFFGPSSKGKAVAHIVESPAQLPIEFDGNDAGAASFPEGVLLDSRALAQGISNEATLELAEFEFAHTWFGWRVRPQPEEQVLMGRGVGLFGLVIAAEARGHDQRARMIESLLDRYDVARGVAADGRMLVPSAGISRAERISTGYRAALFLVALEDLCGHDNLRTAFRDVVATRGNSDVGYEDLRAALENSSRRDLSEMFRTWLIRPGIPEDFRARYGKPSIAR
jgi:hypothetical protein